MPSKLTIRLPKLPWRKIFYWSVLAIAALAVCVAIWRGLSALRGSRSPSPPMQVAPPATVLAGVEKQLLSQPVSVKAYSKTAAVKRLHLSQDVADDPNQQVISSAELKPSKGGYVTATVLDTRTGEAVTRVTEKPRSLIELGGQTELGLRLGITSRGQQQAAVYARQDLVRVGIVTLAGYGEANAGGSTPEAKAMIDARVSW